MGIAEEVLLRYRGQPWQAGACGRGYAPAHVVRGDGIRPEPCLV